MKITLSKCPQVTDFALGRSHSGAVCVDGTLWTWGWNSYGQLGDGSTVEHHTPVQITLGGCSHVTSVALGWGHSAPLCDGVVWTWGWNEYGQLGDGTTDDHHTPVEPALGDVVAEDGTVLSSGCSYVTRIVLSHMSTSAALCTDGTVWGWGDNRVAQLGDESFTIRYTPVQIPLPNSAIDISLGVYHSAAVLSDGTLWTWGSNWYGRLGYGEDCEYCMEGWYRWTTPGQVVLPGCSHVSSVSLGFDHSAALCSDGAVWTWGRNHVGQLGDGTTENRYAPVQLTLADCSASAITLGYEHSAALCSGAAGARGGTVATWGQNSDGQLGNGDAGVVYTSAPDWITFARCSSNVTKVEHGGYHSAALCSDGTLWMWGCNDNGQLGDGTTADRYTPMKITLSNCPQVTDFALGRSHS